MSTPPLPVDEDVLTWVVRTSDRDFADWPAFAAWLDEDPARNRAYDAAMIAVMATAEQVSSVADVEPAEPAAPRVVAFAPPARRPRSGWAMPTGALALAAGIAGVFLVTRPDPAPATRTIETLPGQTRTIALADGSRVDLAGGSRLRLDPTRPRSIALERGRALFTVRHDAAAPFSVTANGHRIVDVGTAFEVSMPAAGITGVAVTEGRVVVDPARIALALDPGDAAQLHGDRAPVVSRVAVDAIGQWRHARMTYRQVPLARVAGDLSAALGQSIVVPPDLGARPFSGTLVPATLRDRPQDLAALLDVRVRTGEQGWELRPR